MTTPKTYSLTLTTLLLTNIAFAQKNQLEDITVISTTKISQSIANTTSNITVITDKDIEEHGYQTVAEAISHTAGISTTTNGGLGKVSTIFLRGMKTEKILLLLDGVTLNNPNSTDGQAFFEHITLENIQRIEIVKGGASSIWGADASAGVINMITKEPKEGVAGILHLSYGTYHTKKLSSTLSYKQDKIEASIHATKLKSDGFSALQPRKDEADGYKNDTFNLKLKYHVDAHQKVGLSYHTINANTQYDNRFSTLRSNDPVANIDTDQKDFSLHYLYHSDTYQATLKFAQSKSNRVDMSNSTFGDARSTYYAKQKEVSWIQHYQYHTTNLTLGLESKKSEGKYQFNTSTPTHNSFHDKAIFVNINHRLNKLPLGKTLVEGSIRRDILDQFTPTTSYKLGFKQYYTNLKGLTTSANYYKAIDTPNAYQVANRVSGVTLHHDTTKGYDISIHYKDIGLTYFSNVIQDKLAYDFTSFGYTNNQGKERVKGIEVTASHLFENLAIIASVNYTHLFTYTNESGQNLSKRAKDTLHVGLDRYTQEDTHYGIDMHYIGDREESGNHTGNYTIWNANFSTQITNYLGFSLHAKNIFNKDYETTTGYATAGRSLYAKLKYKF